MIKVMGSNGRKDFWYWTLILPHKIELSRRNVTSLRLRDVYVEVYVEVYGEAYVTTVILLWFDTVPRIQIYGEVYVTTVILLWFDTVPRIHVGSSVSGQLAWFPFSKLSEGIPTEWLEQDCGLESLDISNEVLANSTSPIHA